jgi:branched-chain amino acid transport system substrate-binding protein
MRLDNRIRLLAATVGAACALTSGAALAQANEQFFPSLVYRTGAYAPNGVPFANGYADYLKLINARDGGINGVRVTFEECETGYATDRGVECYERLKGRGPTGAAAFHTLSTGITFAVTDKSFTDKIPVVTAGYGRSDSQDGRVFKWNFPLSGHYWTAADILVQHLGKVEGSLDKLKGKKIALVYHDSPFGKEPIPLLQERGKRHGFELMLLPVTHPGVEQKATWLQIRQQRPDYVFLWGWGVMNSTALKEAMATGYPRDKMYGVWWSAAEPDVEPVGAGAKGYSGLVFQAGAGRGQVHADILKHVYEKGQGTGPVEMVGQVLYNRGMVAAMTSVEAVRKAQERHGKKPLTGEQVQWGFENLNLDAQRIKEIGFEGYMTPLRTSCENHMGEQSQAYVHTWDGAKWVKASDIYTAEMSIIKPMVEASAKSYAAERNLPIRDCAKEK